MSLVICTTYSTSDMEWRTFDLWLLFFLLAPSASSDMCQCFSVSAGGQWSQLFWIGVLSSEDTLF